VTSQYQRGRAFEYATRDDLREHGYEVIRRAGSKTKVDLAAFKSGELLLIQCKLTAGSIPTAEWNKLFSLAEMIGDAKAIVARKVPGRAAPEYMHLKRRAMPGVIRRAGQDYVAWLPDQLGA
jgi:Holliday junction resolvase